MTTQTLRKQSARLVSLEGKKCEDCGEEKKKGKQNLSRHHFEDKPDKIRILCRKCHAKVHKEAGTWGRKRKQYLIEADNYRRDHDMDEKTLRVTCRGTTTIPIEELENFQGKLKTISEEELQKLKHSILTKGFAFPVFIWEGHKKMLDGHQRVRAALELINEEGYILEGPVPCVEIPAENEEEAREKLLLISSRYGRVTEEGLRGFIVDLNLEEIKLSIDFPEIDLSFFEVNPDVDFKPVGGEEQPRLDEKKPTICPECGHEF